MWIDPEDHHHHLLFACGAFDNIPDAKMELTAHGYTRMVLRYAYDAIETALESFEDEDTQKQLRENLTSSINTMYQKDQLTDKQAEPGKKYNPQRWIASKVFLDHRLIDEYLKVVQCYHGSHFAITILALEQIFNKTEWLPVSTASLSITCGC